MASKRLSDGNTIYPPKKRALYEHMKHNGIDKFTVNQITATGILEYQDNLRVYGVGVPVDVEIKPSGAFSRPRSDSLQSQLSSNSDHTETGSTESRETSPCTIQALFDHHTPERNPITSLDGLKPDISKPLFPPCDSDHSMAGSEGHISPEISMYGEPEETESEHSEKMKFVIHTSKTSTQLKTDNGKINNLIADRQTFQENIPENVTETFHENNVMNNPVQNNIIPAEGERLHAGDFTKSDKTSQKKKEVYMGPMVSLLQRFNVEALQSGIGLKIKEQITEGEVENSICQITSKSHNDAFSYPYKYLDAVRHLQNEDNMYVVSGEINPVQREKIFCPLCRKEFATRAYLHNHMKTHENKSIPCWVCKEVFQTAEGLNAHMKVNHKGENPYKCEHCSREFSQYNNLRRHMRVHREKVYKCNMCNREFNEEFYLKMHMGTHTGKRVYSCGVCGEGFQSNHDLKMHVKTHSPSLLHTCNVCGKSFSKACVLRQHKKGHSGERPHKCDKCDKTFIHRHHLTMHLKSHLEEKRLSCDICKKEFSQHSHLYKHLRAHEEMKEFGMGVKSSQNMENERKQYSGKGERSLADEVNAKRIPKIVFTSDEISLKSVKYESLEKHPVADGMKETSKLPKQQRHAKSQHSLPLSSHNMVASPATGSSKSESSISQTFIQQMGRYPNVPFIHGVPQSYHPVSQAPPMSIYNPLIRNRVPVPLPGYQSYSQLYRNYSEQMQTYYNNMCMIDYISKNAILQGAKDRGHSIHNFSESEGLMHTNRSERTYKHFFLETNNIIKPKVVQDIETLDIEQDVNVVEDKNLKKESGSDNDSLDAEDIDVVNETVEPEFGTLEKRKDAEMKVKSSLKVDTCEESEEHEIAQELLKMSAGKEADVLKAEMKNSNFAKPIQTPKKEDGMHRGKFTSCVNEIIERTVRNGNVNTECATVLKTVDTDTHNFAPFISVSKLHELQKTDVLKSVSQDKMVNFSLKENVSSLLPAGEIEDNVNSRLENVNKIVESQTNPLQKLKMFVALEKTNFKKTEAVNEHPQSFFIHQESEQINQRSEIPKADNNGLWNPGSEFLERPVSQLDENGVTADSVIRTVEDSLENRLEKIRQFADIGLRLGKLKSEENIESNEYESRASSLDSAFEGQENDVEDKEEEDFDSRFEIQQPRDDFQNMNREGGKDVDSEKEMAVSGYFDDSFEDRQLEIVESDKAENFRQLSIGENNEENSCELNKSAGKGFVFTEKEFMCHMSGMIHVSQRKSEDTHDLKEESIKVIEDNRESKEKADDVNKHNNSDVVYSYVNKDEIDECLKYGNGNIKQKQGQETGKGSIGLIERSFYDKSIETGAVDLRTESRQNEYDMYESAGAAPGVQTSFENEDMPMDLSLNGKRKHKLGKSVEKSENLKQHIDNRYYKTRLPNSLHFDSLYFCQFCDQTFEQSEKLEQHVNLHKVSEKPYICNTCHRGFTHRHNLNRHKMSHNSKSYECNLCKRSFKESFYLQMHMKTHVEEKCHKCQICGENVRKAEIWRHTNQHLGNISQNPTYQQIGYRVQEILREQNFSIKIKQEKSETETVSNNHLEFPVVNGTREELGSVMKTGEVPYKLDPHVNEALNLKKENIENWNVRKDKKVDGMDMRKSLHPKLYEARSVSVLTERKIEDTQRNSGIKPVYECSVCNKVLQTRHELGNHMGIHNGTRPFVCNICGRAFKKGKGLRMHEKLHLNPSAQV